MPQTKPMVSIENVVASATIDQDLDLFDVQKKFPTVEYNPDLFPGAVFRLKKPKTATLLFRTGKMVFTGSKSKDMARKAVKTVVKQIREGKIKIKKRCQSGNTKYCGIYQPWWKNCSREGSTNSSQKHV